MTNARERYRARAIDLGEEIYSMDAREHMLKAAGELGRHGALQEAFDDEEFTVGNERLADLAVAQVHGLLAISKLLTPADGS